MPDEGWEEKGWKPPVAPKRPDAPTPPPGGGGTTKGK